MTLFTVVWVLPEAWDNVWGALCEAYLAVSVIMAGTLALVYAVEQGLKTDLGLWLMCYCRWQSLAGALLGAFPAVAAPSSPSPSTPAVVSVVSKTMRRPP